MTGSRAPRREPELTIGLPVYNGERYLEAALTSLLSSEFEDFELIVSDNASTDTTPQILTRFAKADDRIRLFRQEKNLGGPANFNTVMQMARTPFFKWAGHDDLVDRAMIGSCLEALHRDPDAIVAAPTTIIIDENGHPLGEERVPDGLASSRPGTRFLTAVRRVGHAHMVFGVMRTGAIQKIGGLRTFNSADLALMAEIALHGKVISVDEATFYRRFHDHMSWKPTGRYEGYREWFRPDQRPRIVWPSWRLWWEMSRIPFRSDLPIHRRVGLAIGAAFVWARRKRSRLRDEAVRGIRILLHLRPPGERA